MFRNQDINDFQAVLETGDDDLENMRVKIEVERGVDEDPVVQTVFTEIKRVFEVSAIIDVQEQGTIAKAFEASIKAPRFVDERR